MRKIAVILSLTLLLGLLAGCQGEEQQQETEGSSLNVQTTTLSGDAFTAADFADNKLTVFNVWATWCPPCVAELPHLQKVSEEFREDGVAVIGVLQDGVTEMGESDADAIASANTLLEDAGVDYPVILPDATLQQTFIRTMQYFPTTFFVDAEGNVIKRVEGAREYEDWRKLIQETLEEMDGQNAAFPGTADCDRCFSVGCRDLPR